MEQVECFKSQKENPCKDVLIEEFILGNDYSCMVLKTVDGVIPLRPIIYEYPKGWKPEDYFLDWEAKCAPLMDGRGRKGQRNCGMQVRILEIWHFLKAYKLEM